MGHCLCKVIKSRSFEYLTKETKDSSLFSEKDIARKLGSSLEDVGLNFHRKQSTLKCLCAFKWFSISLVFQRDFRTSD